MTTNESFPWAPPLDIAEVPQEQGGDFRYDAEAFYTGELSVKLLYCKPHAKEGASHASSIKITLGAQGPGIGIRWDEFLGLDFSNDYNKRQMNGFFTAFAPGYLGSEAHRAGQEVDLAQLPGRWAFASVKKELDTFGDRPPRHKPRVVRFLEAIAAPRAIDEERVRVVQVEIAQHGGAPRAAAPGARPPRPTGAPQATAAPAQGARPAGGVPPRPAAPVQQNLVTPPPASHEDSDLPF